jgi:hypothetical protein
LFKRLTDNFHIYCLNVSIIVLIVGLGLIFLYGLGCLAYTAFHTTSNYDELVIKKGKLLDIKGCKYQRGGRSYVLATIRIDDKIKNFKLPCGQDVSLLGNEIGNEIEIREDPHHFSLFASNLNVWNISSGNKVYYSYDEAFKHYGLPSTHAKNVFYIICIITFGFYLKYHKDIHLSPRQLFSKNVVAIDKYSNKITYYPSNLFIMSCLLILSYIAIPTLYYGIFIKRMFLLIAVPLLAIIYPILKIAFKNRYEMVLLYNGIECESFNKFVNGKVLNWNDITDIKRGTMHRNGNVLYICLKKRDVESSIITKLISKYTFDLTISGANFHNGIELIENILYRFSLYKDQAERIERRG